MPKIKPINFERISSLQISNSFKENVLLTFKGYENISVRQRYEYVTRFRNYYCDSVKAICDALCVSKSGYYTFLSNDNYKYKKDLPIINAIEEIQNNPDSDRSYGVYKVKVTLEKDYAYLLKNGKISKGKVRRLMLENGLECRDNDNQVNKIRNSFNEYPRLVDSHVASKIGEKLGTDITLKIADNKKVFVSVVQDSASALLLSWKISRRASVLFVKNSILEAKKLIKDVDGTIIHSDKGRQYTSKEYKTLCEEIRLIPSMSRKATPTDNAQTENVFSCLVREKLFKHKYSKIEDLINAINEYFIYYNNKRIHSRLKMTPREYFDLHYLKK